MIKLVNLWKYFKDWNDQIEILKDVNLEINSWEFISIIWPSWSWKSTFLNLLSGLDREYSWDIYINDINLKTLTNDEITAFRWRNISYIFQNFKLIENLTIKENVDLIIDLNNLERNFSTDVILEKVWLLDKKDNYVFNLSWWESQRVAIARAFVWKTPIMFLDEPTWALDYKNKKNIMNLINSLHKDTLNTILMITHDLEVAKISDRIYDLHNSTFNLYND